MTEFDIQNKLHHAYPFINHDGGCPNVYVYSWESDMLSITKAGFVHECEIKVTKSDFNADSKKVEKHCVLKNGWRELHEWELRHKEKIPAWGNPHLNSTGKIDMIRPNYFWYVCPADMVKVENVPEYAGLIYINDSHWLDIIKQAKRLHKDKITDKQKNHIIRSFEFKYWNLRRRFSEMQLDNFNSHKETM